MPHKRSVEIYLSTGGGDDLLIHETRLAFVRAGRGRMQAIFRRALLVGLQEMSRRGEFSADALPDDIRQRLSSVSSQSRAETIPRRRRRRRATQSAAVSPPPVETRPPAHVRSEEAPAPRGREEAPAEAASLPKPGTVEAARSRFARLM